MLDLWRGRMSVRRAWLLIEHLPEGSALARAVDPDASAWPLSNHLLAGIFDTLQRANWQRAGNADTPVPPQLARPGVADQRAEAAQVADERAQAFLERQRRREAI